MVIIDTGIIIWILKGKIEKAIKNKESLVITPIQYAEIFLESLTDLSIDAAYNEYGVWFAGTIGRNDFERLY